jgi:hypothetical protein
METILNALAPYIAEIIGGLALLMINALRVELKRRTGIQVSDAAARRLSDAFERAAALALQRKLTGPSAVDLMLDYLRTTLPETLAQVAPAEDALRLRAEASMASARAKARGIVPTSTSAVLPGLTDSISHLAQS